MDSKTKKKKSIFYIISSLVLVVGIGVTSLFPMHSNNVKADSTSFINRMQYHISTGSLSDYMFTYSIEQPLIQLSIVDQSFISFESMSATSGGNIRGNNIYFNYVDYNHSYKSLQLGLISSELYGDTIYATNTGLVLSVYSFYYIPQSDEYGSFLQGTSLVDNISLSFPFDSTELSMQDFFDVIHYTRSRYEIIDNSNVKYTAEYSNTSDFSNILMRLSISFSSADFPMRYGTEYITHETLKIDRSEFIIHDIIEVPTGELRVFDAIVNGVNSFLEIEVFPNFTFSHILLLTVGVTILLFMLHLIAK